MVATFHDRALGGEIAPFGGVGKLADGGLVAHGLELEEHCRRAAIVIAVHDDPPPKLGGRGAR